MWITKLLSYFSIKKTHQKNPISRKEMVVCGTSKLVSTSYDLMLDLYHNYIRHLHLSQVQCIIPLRVSVIVKMVRIYILSNI